MQAGVQPADADDESQLPSTCWSVFELFPESQIAPITCAALFSVEEHTSALLRAAFASYCHADVPDEIVSKIMEHAFPSCLICMKPCDEFHTLCSNHYEQACWRCVRRLMLDKKPCPFCKQPLYTAPWPFFLSTYASRM